jgi:hypothetical protein
MNEEKIVQQRRLYQGVAELLGVPDTYMPFPHRRRTRWTTRLYEFCNGRFEGFGIVRMFGPKCIHVALNVPKVSGTFNSVDAALEAIKQALTLVSS